MNPIYVVPVPGSRSNESLTRLLGAMGISDAESLAQKEIRGKKVTAIECKLGQLKRLQGIPLFTDDFEAWRQDGAGRWTQLHPITPPKLLIRTPSDAIRRAPGGKLQRGAHGLKRRAS